LAVINGTAGDDALGGTTGGDTINGLDGDDLLFGDSGNDTLNGGNGFDILEGGLGNDTLNGGADFDFATYVLATSGVTVSLAITGAQNTGSQGLDTLVGIEGIFGSDFNDSLTGGVGDDWLIGSLGLDTINGGDGDDLLEIVDGDFAAGETYSGGAGYDILLLGAIVNLSTATLTGIEDLISDHAVSLTAAQLDALTNLTTGTITVTTGGIVDLAGGIIETPGFNLTAATTLNLSGSTWVGGYVVEGSTGDDIVTGGTVRDLLHGNDGHDTLRGEDGDDLITAALGNDALYGAAGNDVIDAGQGDNLLDGGDGLDSLFAADGNDTLYGGLGDDLLSGGNGLNTFVAGDGNDAIMDGDGDNTLNGEAGNDNLRAGGGADMLNGGDGDDELDGELGADTMFGGSGHDILHGETTDLVLQGGLGNDTIHLSGVSTPLSIQIVGGPGHDTLHVLVETCDFTNATVSGVETFASTGVELIVKAEQIDGASLLGMDAVRIRAGGTVSFAGATIDVDRFFLEAPDIVLDFTGSLSQRIFVDGGDYADTVTAGQDDDVLNGFARNDTLNGAGGVDIVYGGDGADVLGGGDGDDEIYGEVNGDTLDGGDGNDELFGGGSGDTMYGGAGEDVLWADLGDDTLYGGDGDDQLLPGWGANSVYGGGGDDGVAIVDHSGTGVVYDGGDGRDQLVVGTYDLSGATISGFEVITGFLARPTLTAEALMGFSEISVSGVILTTGGLVDLRTKLFEDGSVILSDEDTILYMPDANPELSSFSAVGGAGNDELHASNWGDTFTGGAGDDQLIGHVGEDDFHGGEGIDHLLGNGGNDELFGDAGDDVLVGGDGDDELHAGGGVDMLDAGTGDDILFIDDAGGLSGELSGGDGFDTITINLTNANVTALTYSGIEAIGLSSGTGGVLTMTAAQLDSFAKVNSPEIRLTTVGTVDMTGDIFIGSNIYLSNAGDSTIIMPAVLSYLGAYVVFGGKGDDTITGGIRSCYFYGGKGDDVLIASPPTRFETMSLYGGEDDDMLSGTVEADLMFGGAGSDYIDASAEDDTYDGGDGIDWLSYADATAGVTVTLSADKHTGIGKHAILGIENVKGGAFDDVLTGDAGNNVMDGSAGINTMAGGFGDDTYFIGGTDTVVEKSNQGFDTALSSIVAYTLTGNVEQLQLLAGAVDGTGNSLANTIDGNSDANTLDGGGGDDTIAGGLGDDTLLGNNGADTLAGGIGADQLNGGAGSDVFLYAHSKESRASAYDTVTAFDADGADRFDLTVSVTGIDAIIASGALSAATLKGDLKAAADRDHLGAGHAVLFAPDSGDLAGTTFLIVDGDGRAGFSATRDLVIRLDAGNPANLDVSDFI
jgi:Ca2+-binding RTX toxin-like protein